MGSLGRSRFPKPRNPQRRRFLGTKRLGASRIDRLLFDRAKEVLAIDERLGNPRISPGRKGELAARRDDLITEMKELRVLRTRQAAQRK